MQYTHKISKRARNLTIKISPQAEVIVVTPPRFSQRLLNKFIKEKEPWITKTVAKIKIRRQMLSSEENILIFGKEYKKTVLNCRDRKIGIYTWGDKLIINLLTNSLDDVKNNQLNRHGKTRLARFLKNTAEQYITPRTFKLAEKMDLKFKKITLRQQKTRWGSCSSRGGLNFNWRLVHLEPIIIDYVIIHELAHLEEMNHSVRFWNLVAKFDPQFKQHRKILKRYQYTID